MMAVPENVRLITDAAALSGLGLVFDFRPLRPCRNKCVKCGASQTSASFRRHKTDFVIGECSNGRDG